MPASRESFDRGIGVLLHPTALPSKLACGTFGEPAREWLGYLSENLISVWQFLPLAPCDSTGSPYSSPSGFALNPWFLDPYDLVSEGFLPKSIIDEIFDGKNSNSAFLNISLANEASDLLAEALLKEWPKQIQIRHKEFLLGFCKKFIFVITYYRPARELHGFHYWSSETLAPALPLLQ